MRPHNKPSVAAVGGEGTSLPTKQQRQSPLPMPYAYDNGLPSKVMTGLSLGTPCTWGWRESSVVRAPKFGPQHPHGGSQLAVT